MEIFENVVFPVFLWMVKTINSRCWIQSIRRTRLVNAQDPINMIKDGTAFSNYCVFEWMNKKELKTGNLWMRFFHLKMEKKISAFKEKRIVVDWASEYACYLPHLKI